MFKKIKSYLYFTLKYELKRNKIVFMILLLFLLIYYCGWRGNISGGISNISHNVNSIQIKDMDNSNLSGEFISFLKNRNYTLSNTSLNKVDIPYNFERDYANGNATILGDILGIGKDEIYEFQLQKLNDTNRIKFTMRNVSSDIVLLGLVLILNNSFIELFINSRRTGKLHFMSNFINFWAYFFTNNIITFALVFALLISGAMKVQFLLLIIILFLSSMIIVFKMRRNFLVDRVGWVTIGFMILLVTMKVNNLYYLPIVDLLFPYFNPIIIVDIILAIILFYIVSKIKLTEA